MNLSNRARGLLAAVLAIIAAGGITIAVTDNGSDHGPNQPRGTVTVTLGGAQKLGASTPQKVALPPAAQTVAKTQAAQDAAGNDQAAHSDLRAEPPAASSPATLKADAKVAPSGQPVPPAHIPLATVNQPGCRTLLVRNQSSRTGAPSLLIVLHQTISADNGWAGVLGNVRWFDSSAAQASSNYIVARTGGQCAYIVPETAKAWAQAGFNRVTPCSIEVTETGREGSYLPAGSAGRARVIGLVAACARRWHIPLQHGRVSGCTVVRPGVVEHHDLGSCGGGHFDDTPYSVDDVIAAARARNRSSSTPRLVVVECRRLEAYRREVRARRHPSAQARARARARKALVGRRGYKCGAKGVPTRA